MIGDLNGLVRAVGGRFGGSQLGHSSVLHEGLPRVLQQRRLVDQQSMIVTNTTHTNNECISEMAIGCVSVPGRVYLHAHVCELLLDGVEGGDGLLEGLSLLGISVVCGPIIKQITALFRYMSYLVQ